MASPRNRIGAALILTLLAVATITDPVAAKDKKKKPAGEQEDPFAEYVWPAPPGEPRIKLEAIYAGRVDVEVKGKFKKTLARITRLSNYDRLLQPFGAAFDREGRILVTDTANAALLRFDTEGRRLDVLGTQGKAIRLNQPLGIHVGPDGAIYVADVGLKMVVAMDSDGAVTAAYGTDGQMENPTDVALTADGARLLVTDSKLHVLHVFDRESQAWIRSVGRRGEGEGEFAFPTSVAVGPEGEVYVVDQINARVQRFDADLRYLDEFGSRGTGFGQFVRPKDIAVDEVGLIYVTDAAFNNLQLFDIDFSLLTFVGEGGKGPGQFNGLAGVAVQGDRFVLVDSLNRRIQLFRFLVAKDQ